jgi:hypothetical protein
MIVRGNEPRIHRGRRQNEAAVGVVGARPEACVGGLSRSILGWEIGVSAPEFVLLGRDSLIGMPGELLFKRKHDAFLFCTYVQHNSHRTRDMGPDRGDTRADRARPARASRPSARPMNRGAAAVVEEFIRRQREMYGNNHRPVGALVADDVVWHVRGTNPTAGGYRAARRSSLRRRRMQSPAKPAGRSRRLVLFNAFDPLDAIAPFEVPSAGSDAVGGDLAVELVSAEGPRPRDLARSSAAPAT